MRLDAPPGDAPRKRGDGRILFRDGWMLILFLVCFGVAACGLFWWSSPRGSAGWIRLAVSFALVLLAGGIAAPLVTRTLYRRR